MGDRLPSFQCYAAAKFYESRALLHARRYIFRRVATQPFLEALERPEPYCVRQPNPGILIHSLLSACHLTCQESLQLAWGMAPHLFSLWSACNHAISLLTSRSHLLRSLSDFQTTLSPGPFKKKKKKPKYSASFYISLQPRHLYEGQTRTRLFTVNKPTVYEKLYNRFWHRPRLLQLPVFYQLPGASRLRSGMTFMVRG